MIEENQESNVAREVSKVIDDIMEEGQGLPEKRDGFIVQSSKAVDAKVTESPVEPNKHRWMALRVAPWYLEMLFKGMEAHIKIESSLPDDAEFISCFWENMSHTFVLVYSSEEFEEQIEGSMLEFLPSPVASVVECPLVGKSVDDVYIMFPKEHGDVGFIYNALVGKQDKEIKDGKKEETMATC